MLIKIAQRLAAINKSQMDELVAKWRSTLSEKERALHDLAQIKLKKELHADAQDGDNGSYFPEKSHAFRKWLKAQAP